MTDPREISIRSAQALNLAVESFNLNSTALTDKETLLERSKFFFEILTELNDYHQEKEKEKSLKKSGFKGL